MNDNWIKPDLKSEMENIARFLHPLSEDSREVFREGFRSALATINYNDITSQLEALKKENEELREKRDRALTKAQTYENDWMQSKHEFGMRMKEVRNERDEAFKHLVNIVKEQSVPDFEKHVGEARIFVLEKKIRGGV